MATSPTADAAVWLARLDTLVRLVRHQWPQHDRDLDTVLHHAQQIAHWLPRALAYLDPGDGLRSPSLESSGPPARAPGPDDDPELAGRVSYSDPTASTALATENHDWDLRRIQAGQDHAPVLLRCALTHHDPDRARANITAARQALANALGVIEALLPAPSTVKRLKDTGDKGCLSCRRIPMNNSDRPLFNDVHRSGLCRVCYDEANANHNAWVARNPTRAPEPVSARRWWPAARLVAWRRDNPGKYLSPQRRRDLEAPRKRRAG